MDEHLVAGEVLRELDEVGLLGRSGVELLLAEPDHDPVLIDVDVVAALSDRHRDATPIRIGSVDRRLHERRVHDCFRDSLRLRVVAPAVDRHDEQLRRALTIAGDHAGERERHLVQPDFEPSEVDWSRGSARHDCSGVARGGVGVDAHRIQRAIDDPPEHRVEIRRVHGGVGHEQCDQRRHVGLDHPDALGEADDRHVVHHRRRDLCKCVRGHDAEGRGLDLGQRRRWIERREVHSHPVHWVATPDDTGGGDEHVVLAEVVRLGDTPDHLTRVFHALRPRGDVRVLRHHDVGLQCAVGDTCAAENDAWPCESTPREHRGGAAPAVRDDDDEVVGLILDADVRHVRAEAGRKRGGHGRTVDRRSTDCRWPGCRLLPLA